MAPFRAADVSARLPVWLTGCAPALFYTLAIGLLVGLAAGPTRAARHCLTWTGVALGLELAQTPALAQPVAAWLAPRLADPLWQAASPYWTAGTFDVLDLLATGLAGLLALALTRRDTTGGIA